MVRKERVVGKCICVVERAKWGISALPSGHPKSNKQADLLGVIDRIYFIAFLVGL